MQHCGYLQVENIKTPPLSGGVFYIYNEIILDRYHENISHIFDPALLND